MITQKLGIVGVGHVGEHVLAYGVLSNLFAEIVVMDPYKDIAHGEALDQAHATGLDSRSNIRIYAGDYSDLADADVIIVAATHHYPDRNVPADRQKLMIDNIPVVYEIMSNIAAQTQEAIVIWITNPADTVTYMAITEHGYPKERVFGTGTTLDTARLRHYFGQYYNVNPLSVHGYMLGEHGNTAFAALSRLSIAGISYQELDQYFPQKETPDLSTVSQAIVDTAYDVFHAKFGVTNAAIGQSAIDIAKSVMLDEKTIFPVTTLIQAGEYGLDRDTAFSIPCVIGRQGIERRLLVSLNDDEMTMLNRSAGAINANIDLVDEIRQQTE